MVTTSLMLPNKPMVNDDEIFTSFTYRHMRKGGGG